MVKKQKKHSVFACDYKRRLIWHDGYIIPKTAVRLEKALKKLNKKGGQIYFYIRGPGGDPYATFRMAQLILTSLNPVVCIAHDYANSGCFTVTQACEMRLAMPGTRFVFHPSLVDIEERVRLTQKELSEEFEKLRMIDAIQLMWFTRKGNPVDKIFELFNKESLIRVPQALKLDLIDAYYTKKDFLSDRCLVRKLIKARK